MFWFDGEFKQFVFKQDAEISFNLTYRDLLVGVLSYHDDIWHFAYSDDFKDQRNLLPLINFPKLDKEYKSSQLWPFFASRIPSAAQRQTKQDDNDDVISLLKKYGRKVVANPFVLNPQV